VKRAEAAYVVKGRGGASLQYKKKEEKVEEDTKISPRQQRAPRPARQSAGDRWMKKEDIVRRQEMEAAKREKREQAEIRDILERIFKKDKDDEGIEERELEQALQDAFKNRLLRRQRNNNRSRASSRSNNQNGSSSNLSADEVEKSAKERTGKVIEAMKSGFLSREYNMDFGDAYGNKVYHKRHDDELSESPAIDQEEAKEIDAMAEKFHAMGGGKTFTIKDVQQFFGSADDAKVKKLCHDLKNDIFDDLFDTTQKTSTGEYLFIKKQTNQ